MRLRVDARKQAAGEPRRQAEVSPARPAPGAQSARRGTGGGRRQIGLHTGTSFSLTLTVEDAYGNVVTGYTGTVHFSSTDSRAKLPSNYTFKTTDKGVHTFSGLVLRKKGYQKITITDTHNSSLTGSVIVDVL